VNDAFGADALALAVEAVIKNLFIRVFPADLIAGNAAH
jgi:hypothetical protein